MQPIRPYEFTNSPLFDDPLSQSIEIERSIGVFQVEIAKWEENKDETSKKIVEFLKVWLSLKEKELEHLRTKSHSSSEE
jgi:hypothetical protein